MNTKTKLNDLQLILLSTATGRDGGSLIPVSASIKGENERFDKAIEVLIKLGLAQEVEDATAKQIWRTLDDKRIGVAITDAGKTAIETGQITKADDAKPVKVNPAMPNTVAVPSGSKQALLINLLAREGGATIDELTTATGWLPHTTRAAITGLRKMGHHVRNDRKDGLSRYSIVKVAA